VTERPDDVQESPVARAQPVAHRLEDGPVLADRPKGVGSGRPSRGILLGLVGVLALAAVSAAALVWQAGSTPAISVEPSATPRVTTTTGGATWTVMCNGTSNKDCDGAIGLFSNNLAMNWQQILDASGGRLIVAPRSCPTFNGLTARQCWDVTAVLPSGPFCMVVANDANDPRYPDYFEIGGQDGTDRLGGSPTGWPMCLRSP